MKPISFKSLYYETEYLTCLNLCYYSDDPIIDLKGALYAEYRYLNYLQTLINESR